jgi:hypothetical protein
MQCTPLPFCVGLGRKNIQCKGLTLMKVVLGAKEDTATTEAVMRAAVNFILMWTM